MSAVIVAEVEAPRSESCLHTEADLAGLPDGLLYELWEGKLQMTPPPGASHGDNVINLSTYATYYALTNKLGRCFGAETGFRLNRNPDTVMAPDWAFVATARVPESMPKGYLEFAPDIVLEVRSPSQSEDDAITKIGRWLAYGVRLAWELDPVGQTLTVYYAGRPPAVLQRNDTLTGDDILPGLSLPLESVFLDPAPPPA